jgi:predicted  nucleic acid-binding Zn-ribbon protein
MAEAPTIDVKFQVSEQSTVIVPLAELMRLATATAAMGRVLAERVLPGDVQAERELNAIHSGNIRFLNDALERVIGQRDKARAELVEMKSDRDQARKDWSIASEQVIQADAKRAEVERERDEARARLTEMWSQRERALAEAKLAREALDEREGDMHMRIRKDYGTCVADSWRAKVAEVEKERDAARNKLAEAERQLGEARGKLDATYADAARDRMNLQDERDAERRRAAIAERERTFLRGLVREVAHFWRLGGHAVPGDLLTRVRSAATDLPKEAPAADPPG